jgi:hypothetical protein
MYNMLKPGDFVEWYNRHIEIEYEQKHGKLYGIFIKYKDRENALVYVFSSKRIVNWYPRDIKKVIK